LFICLSFVKIGRLLIAMKIYLLHVKTQPKEYG
jgi:hypothetical protein